MDADIEKILNNLDDWIEDTNKWIKGYPGTGYALAMGDLVDNVAALVEYVRANDGR